MLARENVASAAHIGRHLIDFVEAPIDDGAAETLLAQITDDKIISFRLEVFMEFEINSAYPKSIAFQPAYRCPPMNPPAPQTRADFIANPSEPFQPRRPVFRHQPILLVRQFLIDALGTK